MNSDGIGLGLRICKELVEQNGGTICVKSEGLGRGSCFSFSMKISSFTIKYFIFLTQLVLLELLRFTCRLSAWIVSLEIRYLPSSDKLLLEISVRISNRFSLLRKCKWSEYRALCSYNIATYLVRLRAIKTMSKDFFIKDFYTAVSSIARYISSMKCLQLRDLAWRQLVRKTPNTDLMK